jgi:formylglycine-generating enzyme required for sulfatase activity
MVKFKRFRSPFIKVIVLCLCVLLLRWDLPINSETGPPSDLYQLESAIEWAKHYYRDGKFMEAKKKLEVLFSFMDSGDEKSKDGSIDEKSERLYGKIWLLLGAINEKMGRKQAARDYYQRAKSSSQKLIAAGKPGVEIAELDFINLPEGQLVFLGQQQVYTPSTGSIEKESVKKKKKKIPLLWIIAGIATVAALTAVLLIKKKSSQEFDPHYDARELRIEWILVTGGMFLMGSDSPDADIDEQPVHEVALNSYYISKHEITFDQFQKFVDDTHRLDLPPDNGWGRGQLPVINVPYGAALDFCKWLSTKTGKRISMPTEAQWEKAAGGPDATAQSRASTIYPWGNDAPSCQLVNWCCETHTMSNISYSPGASYYGVLNMAGNVAEWCSDWYSPDYYNESPEVDPTGPVSSASGAEYGYYKVIRGGSWDCNASPGIRIADRGKLHKNEASNHVGFRIVWTPN